MNAESVEKQIGKPNTEEVVRDEEKDNTEEVNRDVDLNNELGDNPLDNCSQTKGTDEESLDRDQRRHSADKVKLKQKSPQVGTNGKNMRSKRRQNRNKGKEMIKLQDLCQLSNQEDQSNGEDLGGEFEMALDCWDKAPEEQELANHNLNGIALNLMEGPGNKEKGRMIREEIVSKPNMRHSDDEGKTTHDCPIKDGHFHALLNINIDECSNLHNRYLTRRGRRKRGNFNFNN